MYDFNTCFTFLPPCVLNIQPFHPLTKNTLIHIYYSAKFVNVNRRQLVFIPVLWDLFIIHSRFSCAYDFSYNYDGTIYINQILPMPKTCKRYQTQSVYKVL